MIHLIDFILCGTALLLAFLIWANINRVNTKANQYFAAFIFCVFLLLLENILLYTKLLKEEDIIFELISIASFTIAPIFYLSVSFYVEPIKKWKTIYYLHFVFAIIIFVLIVLSHLIDIEEKPENINPKIITNAIVIFYIVFSLQVIPYCILAYTKIIKHQKNIQLFNSSVENIDLKWLKNITICIFIIALFWVGDIVFKLSDSNVVFDTLSSVVYFIGIFYIAYYWLKQKEIFPYNIIEKEEIEDIIVETEITEDSRKKLLSDERLEQLKKELLVLMNVEKLFLKDDLSLIKLAISLHISSHLLSYVINKGFGENFYQFINRYRIEEAKKLIVNPKMNHLSILGIGFEVGFNSKTVFNTTFKKLTGQTPSDYKKQNTAKTSSEL